MFELDLNKVRANVAKATTADLLERATVYRDGMEPAALDVIETELRNRGVSYREQTDFGAAHESAILRDRAGTPLRCHICSHAAVAQQRNWHWLFGVVPIFVRRFAYCEKHRPGNRQKLLPPASAS